MTGRQQRAFDGHVMGPMVERHRTVLLQQLAAGTVELDAAAPRIGGGDHAHAVDLHRAGKRFEARECGQRFQPAHQVSGRDNPQINARGDTSAECCSDTAKHARRTLGRNRKRGRSQTSTGKKISKVLSIVPFSAFL